MLGVRDLVSHMLYVAKREGVKENVLIKSSFSKVAFIALAYCYKYGINIRYDILFRKSPYGASNEDIDTLLGERYSRRINFTHAKEAAELTENKKLDEIIVKMINKEVESPLSFSQYIVNSDVFKDSNYEENKNRSSFLSNFLLLPMDSDQVWSLKEILLFAGFDEDEIDKGNFDLRIPLTGKEYDVIEKYLSLYNETMEDEDFESKVAHKFTLSDIYKIRRLPEQLIDSVRLHGARRV